MTEQQNKRLILPALRGVMGNWIFYSCLLQLDEIGKRVQFAAEIHKNRNLSDMIQRQLKQNRSKQIAAYLRYQPERFFNSLVIATYGGEPDWYPISRVNDKQENSPLNDLPEEIVGSVGFLTMRGDEKLFAIDGQHRLAGIKKALSLGISEKPHDQVSVLFVAHQETQRGLERTRRLFTTLNKTAKPVSKGDIIALDEDDVMAICVRRLIENTKIFSGDRIAFVASSNIPSTNTKSLTTIGNLYDVLTLLFTKANTDVRSPNDKLKSIRPDDKNIEKYFSLAEKYFKILGDNFSNIGDFFSSENHEKIVKKNRGNHGGDVLFRPLGMIIFTEIICQLSQELSIESAIKLAAKLPTKLDTIPYKGLMWDVSSKRILATNKVTLRETLLYMLNHSKFKEITLTKRYRTAIDDNNAGLPKPVV